jgi:branched-chain amino acid transport system permease protein
MIGPVTAGYALSANGLNIQFGYAGLLNFGHAAFMLAGAYGTAITVNLGGSLWLGIAIGIIAAVLLGLLLGIPTLRLRADYFAITSIAVAEVIRLVVRSSWAEPVTEGVFGIQGFADAFHDLNPFPPRALYGFGEFVVTGRTLWVIIVGWALVLLSTLLIARLVESPWGRVLEAIREDEDATRSLGKNVFAYKLQALIIGGGIAAVAGIFFALEQQNRRLQLHILRYRPPDGRAPGQRRLGVGDLHPGRGGAGQVRSGGSGTDAVDDLPTSGHAPEQRGGPSRCPLTSTSPLDREWPSPTRC